CKRVLAPRAGRVSASHRWMAVVDPLAVCGGVMGAAAGAGEGGRPMDHDAAALRGEPHGRGKAGEAGADDVCRSGHHTRLRSTMRSSLAFGSFTGARGATKPRATSISRMM